MEHRTGKRRSLSVTLAQLGRMRPFANNSPSENNAMQTRVQPSGRRASLDEGPRTEGPVNSAGEQVYNDRITFRVGVSEDKNKRCRRTMEDTHSFIFDFMQQEDSGYFAIFDGHAGRQAAEYCGSRFHLILADIIRRNPGKPIPDLLDATFTYVDAAMDKMHFRNQGCTAATALLRWEIRGLQQTLNRTASNGPRLADQTDPHGDATSPSPGTINSVVSTAQDLVAPGVETLRRPDQQSLHRTESSHVRSDSAVSTTSNTSSVRGPDRRRVLYTANAGDARVVLCRNGKAMRLSYDHKGSDHNEGLRVQQAGGTILNNRVNGVLAVTRALGDAYMKELVTGHPYTTETVLIPGEDEFIILACDGLWDVCTDQQAVNLVREVQDEKLASKMLVDHALREYSTDNLTVMVVRLGSGRERRGTGAMADVFEDDEGEEAVVG